MANLKLNNVVAISETGGVATFGTSSSTLKYPTGHIVQVTYDHNASMTTHTNQHTNVITLGITRKNRDNNIFVIGNCVWGMANPNGHWRLNRSYNADMSSSTFLHGAGSCDDITTAERQSTSRSEDFTMFDEAASSSYATVYYAIQFYHVVQNGGTLYVNRPVSYGTSTVGTQTSRCQLTLFEVAA